MISTNTDDADSVKSWSLEDIFEDDKEGALMGVEACAIIENHLDVDALRTFTDQLNQNAQLAALMQQYDTLLRRGIPTLLTDLHKQPWELKMCRAPHEIDQAMVAKGWDLGYLAEYDGPFCTLYVYEHLAEIAWYMCRWETFILEPQFRTPLIEATRLISSLLNLHISTTTIYVPDSAYQESLALEELRGTMPDVLAWLSRTCGPPVEPIEAIVQEEEDGSWDCKGYYVTHWLAQSA